MRQIRTSGSMSGRWKRSIMCNRATSRLYIIAILHNKATATKDAYVRQESGTGALLIARCPNEPKRTSPALRSYGIVLTTLDPPLLVIVSLLNND
jgi:hypothetical protein